ncbi:MAG: hypothetical protein IPM16_15265 [Chloroflexi bacterium]|nr:hypothetical protein [Chloroflexota bacterium]
MGRKRRSRGSCAIRFRLPEKGVQAVRYLYELPRQYAYSYREGYYGQSPIARLGWLVPTAVIGVSFAAVMVLFVIGSVAHRAKPAVQLCAVLLLAITGSAFLTYGDNRFWCRSCR